MSFANCLLKKSFCHTRHVSSLSDGSGINNEGGMGHFHIVTYFLYNKINNKISWGGGRSNTAKFKLKTGERILITLMYFFPH